MDDFDWSSSAPAWRSQSLNHGLENTINWPIRKQHPFCFLSISSKNHLKPQDVICTTIPTSHWTVRVCDSVFQWLHLAPTIPSSWRPLSFARRMLMPESGIVKIYIYRTQRAIAIRVECFGLKLAWPRWPNNSSILSSTVKLEPSDGHRWKKLIPAARWVICYSPIWPGCANPFTSSGLR